MNLLAAGFAFFVTLGLTLAWALLEDVLPRCARVGSQA